MNYTPSHATLNDFRTMPPNSLKFGYVEALKYEERVMEVTNKEAVISMRRESFEGFLSSAEY